MEKKTGKGGRAVVTRHFKLKICGLAQWGHRGNIRASDRALALAGAVYFLRKLRGNISTFKHKSGIPRTMKNTHSIGKTGLVVLGATSALLAGCITYVQSPPPPTVVSVPAPPPEPVPAYVEPPADPTVVVIQSESDFYEPLSPYGRWVIVDGYDRCWVPTGVDQDWRPYTSGHWQRTDAGWYWVSDEQWGWATYHYGRWHLDMNYGWVWMPQTLWAPAWVCWREGGGYTGWAPLPPEARIGIHGDLDFRQESIEPRAFCFVEERHLLEPQRPRTVIVNDTTIINQTVNITKIQVVNKTVINEGPRPENVEHASGRKVEVLPVHQVRVAQEATAVAVLRKPSVATDRKPQPAAHPNNRIPNQNAQTVNLPHPAPVKPVVPEQNIARSHETATPQEIKKPVVPDAEHRPAARPVVEMKQLENKREPGTQVQHEPTIKKPVQQTLTPQQKQALEKKRQADEKKRLEEEKAGKPPQ